MRRNDAAILTFSAIALTFCGMFAHAAATGPEKATPTVWEELDIVPMPKKIRLSGKRLSIDANIALVLGKNACEQAKIGANWINARVVERGGKPLAIIDSDTIPTDKKVIVIGEVNDNPLIAAAVKDGVLNIGDNNPGERGYEIKTSADGAKVYLGGADPIGALYACVTFGELLDGAGKDLVWREADVRDWPDQINLFSFTDTLSNFDATFPSMPKKITDATKKAYLDGIAKFHDYLLRRKLTGVNYRGLTLRGEKFVYAPWMDLLREGIEHGKKRGIGALIYAEKPYPGLIKNYPEAAKDRDKLTTGGGGSHSGKGWLLSWSMDDVRRETARNLAEYVKATGFTDVGFHDTDGGWLENPAYWNFRSDFDRKRWGDDYAAATIHIFKTYYDELKKLNPDLKVNFTFYPYCVYIFDDKAFDNVMGQTTGKSADAATAIKMYQKKYGEFWRRLTEAFPYKDVTFCARESTWDSIVNWRKHITSERGIFWWNAVGGKYWEPLFSQGPAWTADFADRRDNIVAIAYADAEGMPLNIFAVREYTWNRETPGARHFAPFYGQLTDSWKWAEPEGDIYRVTLPKVVRNIFGRQAAPYILRAVSLNIDIHQALGRARSSAFDALKTPERLQWQADNATKAAAALNELWDKCRETQTHMGMDDRAFLAFIVIREALNCCEWFAKAKANLMFAEALADEGKLEDSKKRIALAAESAETGKTVAARLLTERQEALKGKKPAPMSRRIMADNIDFAAPAAEIATTSANLVKIAESGGKNKLVLSELAKGRKVGGYLVNGTADMVIDGDPNEKIWASAPTIDRFTLIGQKKLADALTSVKIVRDAENLYLSWICYAAPGKTVQDRDTLDVFLNIPELCQGKPIEWFFSANGAFSSSIPADKAMCRAIKREKHLWSGETRIRVGALVGDKKLSAPWTINLCRNCFYENEPPRISAILPFDAMIKRDIERFPQIRFSTIAAPAPTVALNVKDFETRTVTLPDRVATVASFRVTIDANAVLNQVELYAETYGPDGKRQRSRKLDDFAHIYLREEPKTLYDAEFTEIVEKGGVLLILKSREGEFKRWVRFGGWEGANGVGALFAPADANSGEALAGPCFFSSSVALDTDRISLLNARQGAIELWLTAATAERPSNAAPVYARSETLVFFGVNKKNASPVAVIGQPLSLTLYKNTALSLIAGERGVGSWGVSATLPKPLTPGEWDHLACVWDATATAENQARLYFNGKRLATTLKTNLAAGLADTAIRVGVSPVQTIQIGALKSGYYPAALAIRDFRISHTARYNADFAPEKSPLALDKNTAALFPFNGSLEGRGMTENGTIYNIRATAGIDFAGKQG